MSNSMWEDNMGRLLKNCSRPISDRQIEESVNRFERKLKAAPSLSRLSVAIAALVLLGIALFIIIPTLRPWGTQDRGSSGAAQEEKPTPIEEKLIQELGHENPELREAALRELIRRGEASRNSLKKALASSDPEIVGRAVQALRALDYAADFRLRDVWKERTQECLGRRAQDIASSLDLYRGPALFEPDQTWMDSLGRYRMYYLDDAWQLKVRFKFSDQTSDSLSVVGIADEKFEEDLYPALKAIHFSPKMFFSSFNPRGLIRAVNALQKLGRDASIRALRAYWSMCRSKPDWREFDDQRLFMIVRLLFEPKEGDMPSLNIAVADSAAEDPWIPHFFLVEDIPFLVWSGREGIRAFERPGKHLDFAEASCNLRAKPLSPSESPVRAAQKLLEMHPELTEENRVEIQRQAIRCLQSILPTSKADHAALWKKLVEGPQRKWDGAQFK